MITTHSVSHDRFLTHLSAADGRVFHGFDNGFQVDRNGNSFDVQEISKGWLNPFGIRQDDDRKLKTANNLNALFVSLKDTVASKPAQYNGSQILKVLERYKVQFSAGMEDEAKAKQVRAAFTQAIGGLRAALDAKELQAARTNIDPTGKAQWDPRDFLHKLSKTWAWTPTGRTNFQLHLKLHGNGDIDPMTSRKLFFFEKPFRGRASSDTQKIAQMQNLQTFVYRWLPWIIGNRLNVEGIEANVRRLADRMSSNMDATNKPALDRAVNQIAGYLQHAKAEIQQDRNRDPLWWIWKGVTSVASAPKKLLWDFSDHLAAPVGLAALGSAIHQQWPTLGQSVVSNFVEEIQEGSFAAALAHPAVALALVGTVSLIGQRIFIPGAKSAGQAVMAKVRPTRAYQWSAKGVRNVIWAGSFVPWGAKGVWTVGSKAFFGAKGVVAYPFQRAAAGLNHMRQVIV